MKLRGYQLDAKAATIDAFKEYRSALVVKPTGTGKTVFFASLTDEFLPKRIMIVAHREELIWQARDKVQKITGQRVDVEMGDFKSMHENDLLLRKAPIVVATVQTLIAGGDGGGRLGKFDPTEFSLLIIDEAHHATSPTYRRIIDYFHTNPDLRTLGVTATPDRSDEEALGQIFDTVAFNYEILDAIKDGWLVPIEQQMVSIEDLDFSKIRTQAGDLNGSDLAEVMESEKNLHGVASATIDIIGHTNKRGIGFAASVNHARTLSEIFNRHRPGMSAWVCGKTDKEERKQIISDFAKGNIQFLWNCGVFTEGFDDSGVEVIVGGRPTKSRSLYAQIIGRGTRPHESIAHKLNDMPAAVLRRGMIARSCKPSCLVIDFVGNSGKHKLVTSADILGGNVSEEAVQAAINFARHAKRPVKMAEQLEEEEKKAEEIKKRRLEEEARKQKLVAKAKFKTQKVDPFDVLQIKPNQPRGWDQNKVLTEKQKEFLRKRGYEPEEMEYARAKQLIGIIMDRYEKKLCTVKQADILKRFNYPTDMTFEQASKTIDAIVKNKWRRPTEPTPRGDAVVTGGVESATQQPREDASDDIPF